MRSLTLVSLDQWGVVYHVPDVPKILEVVRALRKPGCSYQSYQLEKYDWRGGISKTRVVGLKQFYDGCESIIMGKSAVPTV